MKLWCVVMKLWCVVILAVLGLGCKSEGLVQKYEQHQSEEAIKQQREHREEAIKHQREEAAKRQRERDEYIENIPYFLSLIGTDTNDWSGGGECRPELRSAYRKYLYAALMGDNKSPANRSLVYRALMKNGGLPVYGNTSGLSAKWAQDDMNSRIDDLERRQERLEHDTHR